MDAKRKNQTVGPENAKKPKMQVCPHAERCYRRNPHHFREYDHPHLTKFMELGDDFVLPDDFPQTRQVIVEQIAVLKLLNPKKVPESNEIVKSNEKNSEVLKQLAKNTGKKQIITSSSNSTVTKASTESTKAIKNNEEKDKAMEQLVKNIAKQQIIASSSSSTATNVTSFARDTMAWKLEKSAPYNLFFVKVPKAVETMNEDNTIAFTDLLCPSLGELKSSLQFNFMIDVMWLMEQYKARGQSKKPLTILYGYEFPDMETFMSKYLPNVTYHMVKMKDPFGTHHSKVGLYAYTDGSLRVVVSTANLYYEDWNHYNQGLWVSPTCKPLPEGTSPRDGESPTKFKSTLLKYLQSYNVPCLQEWIEHVKKIDFSHIRVFLVTSTPGKHYPKEDGSHVHRVTDILSNHCNLPSKTTPQSEGPLAWGINAQASSIGSLGKTPAEWLRGIMLRTLATHKQAQPTANSHATINVVYPTVDNVMSSYFGAEGGGCLPYAKNIHEKQTWLKDYLHQWKADISKRTRVMPHIKSYCRISPCLTKLAYFLLTSANISKSAWGGNIQKDSAVYVRSYEVGVMFMPSLFSEDYFIINKECLEDGRKVFPFIYDLPLTPYKSGDYPWCN